MNCNFDLPTLWSTKEFADCTVSAADGGEFRAHCLVVGQYEGLKKLMEHVEGNRHRMLIAEPASVVERMLEWMYGVQWIHPAKNIALTNTASADGLLLAMKTIAAAEKYNMPKLVEETHHGLGHVVGGIPSIADALHLLHYLSGTLDLASLALQRVIISKALALVAQHDARTNEDGSGGTHATAENGAASAPLTNPFGEAARAMLADATIIPKRSGRPKKATEKAKGIAKAYKRRHTASPAQEGPTTAAPPLHCACRVPEDLYMVQCDHCTNWYHPGCIGKGKYAKSTYKGRKKWAREMDEKRFREQELHFTCLACDADEAGVTVAAAADTDT